MAQGFGGRNGCEALRRRGKSARLPCSGAIDLHESVNPLLPGVTALPVNGVRTDIAACVTRNKKVEVRTSFLFSEKGRFVEARLTSASRLFQKLTHANHASTYG